jgi:hypothetical protein
MNFLRYIILVVLPGMQNMHRGSSRGLRPCFNLFKSIQNSKIVKVLKILTGAKKLP